MPSFRSLCLAVAMTSGGVALAQPYAMPLTPTGPVASITFSPVHLALPMIELMGEFRPAEHVGVAAIGGLGRVSGSGISATATEIGGQFNYYFMHPFWGLHGGVEAIYLHLSDVDVDVTASAAGLTIGPYVGWKYISAIGFTFDGQLGVDFLTTSAKTSNSSTSERRVFPLLNLNIGWSF